MKRGMLRVRVRDVEGVKRVVVAIGSNSISKTKITGWVELGLGRGLEVSVRARVLCFKKRIGWQRQT
jgi:hypothetical protein